MCIRDRAKTVDNFATIEDFRTTYNELAFDVGEVSGLRDGLKTGNNGTLVDAVNVLEDKQFFFQEFVFVASTNQTQFTGNDEFVNDLIFVKDKIQVFKNERHLIEDVDFIISNPTGTGSHKGVTLTGTYASGQANAMSTNDRLHVYSYTGAFVGTNIANSVASFFQKTVENTIYNTNANGVILNGDSSSPTTLLESGYKIQLAGKTFAEDDILLTTGKTLTAPTITDSTMSINSGSITGAVNGTFSGFLDIEGDIDVNGTTNLDVVDIDGAVHMQSTLQVVSTLTVDGNTDLNANLTVDGNTTLGNAATDNITFTGKAASNLRPNANDTYSLGLSSARWSNVYSTLSNVSGTATVGSLTDGTLSITGGDITSVDDITGDTNSVFKSGSSVVNNIKNFAGTHTILDTTSDHDSNANAGSLTGTVSSINNHSTTDLSEGTNLYYTDARVLTKIQATNLTEIKNVTNSSLANDDVLLYNGSAWVNTPMQERVEDIAGAMLSGNTETGLSVTYDDNTGKTNLVVDNSVFTLTGGVTGTATQTAKGNLTIATTLRDLTKTDITDTQLALNDLYDVSDANNSNDQILVQTGSTWSNVTLTEKVEDIVGGMLDGTETGISVSYDDTDGNLDFVIGSGAITNAMLAGSIANDKLAGSIANAKLANSAITIDGTSVALGGSISTNNTQLTQENVEDFVGGMLDGTETGISVSYDDTDGNIDFVVADSDFALTGDVTGTATQTAKGNVSITTTIAANSVALGTDTTGNYIAAVSAGTGVGVSGSGEGATSTISIGQAVGTSDNVQFGNLVLSGDLTVNGSTVTNSSTNTTIEDQLIELGTGNSGSASGDAGFVIERGSDANVFFGWDESADAVTFGTGTFTGASSGDLTITPAAVNTGALTITNASNSGGTARNIYQSTSAPGGSDGAVGDLWILYS